MDDELRLDTWYSFLRAGPPAPGALDERRRRLLRMLVAQLLDQAIKKDTGLDEACASLWEHPQVLSELREQFEVLKGKVEHLHHPLAQRPEVPLQVHGKYTRIEILAAFSRDKGAKVAPWQTGVHWAKESQADLLAFTLDKTSGSFSPTTRYRDYAISRDLIHWESQSVTRADSETGRRYKNHATEGSSILLFARLRADERAF